MLKNAITIFVCILFVAAFIGCNKAPEEGLQTKSEAEISHNPDDSLTVIQTDESGIQSEAEMTEGGMSDTCEHCEKDCLSSAKEKSEGTSETERLEE